MPDSIYPCLWVHGDLKEVSAFYKAVFDDSVILSSNKIVINMKIAGQKIMLLNGNSSHGPTPTISLFVHIKDEKQLKEAWEKLQEKGTVRMGMKKYPWSELYGWIQDKYGFNWQLSLLDNNYKGSRLNPCFMFVQHNAGKAAEAMLFYKSIFREFEDGGILYYTKGEEEIEGYIKHAEFELEGNKFMIMDSSGDHKHNFNSSVSIVKTCKDQEEIDHYWYNLTLQGKESRCGWLTDRYGISWQIVPENMQKIMGNPATAEYAMQQMMKMNKIEITRLTMS